MADISSLGELQASEPLDLEVYQPREDKPRFQFPKAGRYTLRAPESFSYGRTNAGALSVQIDPTIMGPTNEGTVIRFQRLSAKTWTGKDGKPISQVGRYLRAVLGATRVPGDPQQLADLIDTTANRVYEAYVDWRLYAKGEGADGSDLIIEGMDNFPKDANGEPQNFVFSTTRKDDNGNPLRLRANLEITGFVPAQS
jgi:hypothetical protein